MGKARNEKSQMENRKEARFARLMAVGAIAVACCAAHGSTASLADDAVLRLIEPPSGYAAFAHSVTVAGKYDCGAFTVTSLRQANGPGTWQRVFVATPKDGAAKHPAVVAPFYFPEAMLGFDPATGSVESPLALSRTNLTSYSEIAYMSVLAKRGYVVATADSYHLTYAVSNAPANAWAKWGHAARALKRDWPGWSGVGKLVFDTKLLVDLLVGMKEVDAARIGIIGHSLGGKMAFYTGCLDKRIKVVVASDFGIGWDQTNWSDVWYWGDALAAIRKSGFDNSRFLARAGGKPFCLIAGKYDDASSGALVRRVPGYEGDRFLFVNHATGHRPPLWASESGYRFLDAHLK